MVFLKSLVPITLEALTSSELPDLLGDTIGGRIFWLTLISYCLILPFSLGCKNNIKFYFYTGNFNTAAILFSLLVFTFICLCDRETTADLAGSLSKAASEFNFTGSSIFSCLPVVFTCFNYQLIVPLILAEMP